MKPFWRAALLMALTASLSFAGQKPAISPAQEADLRELLKLTGATDALAAQLSQMADHLKPLVESSIPPGPRRHEIAEAFTRKFRARANSESMTELMIPVFAKYLSDDDVKSLIRFYRTPAGQRLLKVMPEMMKESGEAGREWGTKVATDVVEEMAKEYPELHQKP